MLKTVTGVLCLTLGIVVCLLAVGAQAGKRLDTNKEALVRLSESFEERLEAQRNQLYWDMLSSTNPVQMALNQDRDIQLMFIDEHGLPKYNTVDNYDAAESISTDEVWPGGSGGYTLTGAGTVLGRLGIWDAGAVRTTHQEFGGRVTQDDSPGGTHYHATHVAGTMVGAGVMQTCADLRPASFTVSGSPVVAAGESIGSRVAASIENAGNLASGATFVGFYISTNSFISDLDQLLVGGI
jgi:hypothetical protein